MSEPIKCLRNGKWESRGAIIKLLVILSSHDVKDKIWLFKGNENWVSLEFLSRGIMGILGILAKFVNALLKHFKNFNLSVFLIVFITLLSHLSWEKLRFYPLFCPHNNTVRKARVSRNLNLGLLDKNYVLIFYFILFYCLKLDISSQPFIPYPHCFLQMGAREACLPLPAPILFKTEQETMNALYGFLDFLRFFPFPRDFSHHYCCSSNFADYCSCLGNQSNGQILMRRRNLVFRLAMPF